jgi:hypothetical protein
MTQTLMPAVLKFYDYFLRHFLAKTHSTFYDSYKKHAVQQYVEPYPHAQQ